MIIFQVLKMIEILLKIIVKHILRLHLIVILGSIFRFLKKSIQVIFQFQNFKSISC